jgi:hypothetical protein
LRWLGVGQIGEMAHHGRAPDAAACHLSPDGSELLGIADGAQTPGWSGCNAAINANSMPTTGLIRWRGAPTAGDLLFDADRENVTERRTCASVGQAVRVWRPDDRLEVALRRIDLVANQYRLVRPMAGPLYIVPGPMAPECHSPLSERPIWSRRSKQRFDRRSPAADAELAAVLVVVAQWAATVAGHHRRPGLGATRFGTCADANQRPRQIGAPKPTVVPTLSVSPPPIPASRPRPAQRHNTPAFLSPAFHSG